MATMNDDMDNVLQAQFNDAFEEGAPAQVEPSDDEAFGITPPAEAIAAAENAAPAAEAEAAPAPAEIPAAEAETTGQSVQNQADDDAPPELPEDPKEAQRIKSWEGRLKKLEAELKAKAGTTEQAASEVIEQAGEQAEDQGNEALSEAAESVAEQVESGTLSVTQAMKQLAEDFGEDFVKMIEVIAGAKASEVGGQAVSSVKGEVESIIGHIKDSAEKTHFKTIMAAHPDFNDVRQDPAFAAFAQGDPALQRIAEGGSADEVIGLIEQFKAKNAPAPVAPAAPAAPVTPAKPAADAAQADPEGADAAAGVRSGGLRLPAEPADSSDYEGAWNEAAKTR